MAGNKDFIDILREIRGTGIPGEAYSDGIWYELTIADKDSNPGIYGDILSKYGIIKESVDTFDQAVAILEKLNVEVTTLPAGTEATSALVNGVWQLGIPRGAAGIDAEVVFTPDVAINYSLGNLNYTVKIDGVQVTNDTLVNLDNLVNTVVNANIDVQTTLTAKQEVIEAVAIAQAISDGLDDNVTDKIVQLSEHTTVKLEELNSASAAEQLEIVTVADAKKLEYDQNVIVKVEQYNNNHTTKLDVYNANDTMKLNQYNANHVERLENLDEKYATRIVDMLNTNKILGMIDKFVAITPTQYATFIDTSNGAYMYYLNGSILHEITGYTVFNDTTIELVNLLSYGDVVTQVDSSYIVDYLTFSNVILEERIDQPNGVAGLDENGKLSPVILTQDANNRLVTDLEKSTWNAKASTAVVTTIVNGLMIAEDKIKLDAITGSNTGDQTTITGNAGTATKLQTPRAIQLSGAVTGTADFDGSTAINIVTANTADPVITLAGDATGSVTLTNLSSGTLTVSIVDDSHNHVIANVDGLQAALDAKVDDTEKGVSNGIATLDANGKVVLSQINDSILGQLEYKGVWNLATMPTATEKGQYWIASAAGNGYEVGDWAVYNGVTFDKVDNTDAVSSVAGRTGVVVLTKTDVGLNNVDNTTDATKNVLSATKWTDGRTITIGSTGKSVDGGINVSWSLAEIGAQAADADLTAIAALGGTSGLLKKTATDTWTLDTNTYVTSSGVTSVKATSPVASSGGNTPTISLNANYGDTLNPYASKSANYILAAPNGSAGSPTFRALVASDIPTLNQNTTGSAATLTNAKTLAITGDLTWTSPAFNGSGNVTAVGTLATVNSNIGTFTNPSITVNAKGLVTAASSGTAPVTSVSGTAPIVSSGGATPAISISAATTSAAGSMSAADKTKLDGIATGANNYVHPTTDGSLHVPATGTTNNGKVLTADSTAGSFSWQTPASGVTDHTLLSNVGTNTHTQIDTALTRLANTSGTNTGDQTTVTGNAGTATKLQTARTINGVSFDGSTNITINAVDSTARQPLDADLTAIVALAGTSGLLKKTAANTWTLDTNVYVTSSGVTSVSGTAPVVSSGGTTPAISMAAATASVNGYMTNTYASKLDGIAAGADVNVQSDWNAVSGDAFILNKPTIPTVDAVPTNGSTNAVSSDGVFDALALKAPLASPIFTTPNIGVASGTSFNNITGLATVTPVAAGTAAVGTSTTVARQDHVHPAQTTITGNAATATKLATARTIGGVSFDGTANIDLPGVNTTGNQNTTGNAATATTANALNSSNSYTGVGFTANTGAFRAQNLGGVPTNGVTYYGNANSYIFKSGSNWEFKNEQSGFTNNLNTDGAIVTANGGTWGIGITGSSASCTGNSATATKLTSSSGDWSASGVIGNVVGMLAWKHYGNGHAIFDASNGTAPNGAAVNNTNSQYSWNPTYPTLMGWNGTQTHGVRVDSARVADSTTYASAFTTAVGSAPSYACRAWVNFKGTGTVTIRASGNVSSVDDNGTGIYTVNFITAMPDADYSAVTSSTFSEARTQIFSTSSVQLGMYNSSGAAGDAMYVSASIFR